MFIDLYFFPTKNIWIQGIDEIAIKINAEKFYSFFSFTGYFYASYS